MAWTRRDCPGPGPDGRPRPSSLCPAGRPGAGSGRFQPVSNSATAWSVAVVGNTRFRRGDSARRAGRVASRLVQRPDWNFPRGAGTAFFRAGLRDCFF